MIFKVREKKKPEEVVEFWLSEYDGTVLLMASIGVDSFYVCSISEAGIRVSGGLPDNLGIQTDKEGYAITEKE